MAQMLQEAVEELLDMANIPHQALLSASTSINDVHGDDSGNTKTSNDAGDDTTDKDSLHHVLTSFHDGLL